MAFCASCGTAVADGARFCAACGAPTIAPQPAAAPPQAQWNPAPPPAVPPPQQWNPTVGATSAAVGDYMVQSILCLFLCLPAGIVALVNASKANNLKATGDIANAQTAARTAKTWCWVALWVGVGVTLLWIIVAIASAASTTSGG